MAYKRFYVLLLGGLVCLSSGCSSKKPVNILVTMDGKGVEGATVTLNGEGLSSPVIAVTGADGTATLDSARKDGVPPGSYKVTVSKIKGVGGVDAPIDPSSKDALKFMKMKSGGPGGQGPAPKSELPAVYNDPKGTPLTLKVPPDSNPVEFKLNAK